MEHAETIAIGKQGEVSLALRPGGTVTLPARIVWSRFGKGTAGNQKVFRSGLVFPSGRADVTEDILELLMRAGVVRLDEESLSKKELARAVRAQRRAATAVTTASAEPELNSASLTLARKARQHLRNHPNEAGKWLSRARYTTNRAKGADRVPLDQLAVWEFLGRKVDLQLVRLAFELR